MPKALAKKIVKNYADYLRSQGFDFDRIYLYGSYAKGTPGELSDIDVCVVSKIFGGKKWDEMEKKLWYMRRNIDSKIEPIGVSPEEFENSFPLADEIKKNGILIASSNQ